MKKHQATPRKAPRRKKTNAEIRIDRAKRPTESKPMTVKTEDFLKDLKEVENECRVMLSTSLSVAGLLRNKEAISKIDDVNELANMSRIYAKDIETYKTQLDNIARSVNPNVNLEEDPDAMMHLLTVGQAYQEWIVSYQSVVVPMQLAIHQKFTEAADREQARLSATEEVVTENV